ncbi:hypothetical protein K3495_g13939 [Podosphaera aphanis]|nr:hypothetical protein K3495_g13939 [Podosphaera aphanis]
MEDDPFEDCSSRHTGNTFGSGGGVVGGAGRAPTDVVADLRRFKLAVKEDNTPPRGYRKMLEKAVKHIENLLRLKANPSKTLMTRYAEENPTMTKILQEINVIKVAISKSVGLATPQDRSWAKIAGRAESSGTVIRIQDENEKKEIAKLTSEELVKKIGLKEVVGARQMVNGQIKVFFAGEGTKQVMDHQKGCTSKLAASAQVATPSYQVLLHDMPYTFQPESLEHLKELQRANELYVMGMRIVRATWLKKNKQPGKSSGSVILWIEQAGHADKVIDKGLMWKYENKAAEIFRSGFRTLQCFNCQRYGHVALHCTADSKCGHCAGTHNTRNCPGKQDARCCNCGKKHAAWHQSCPVKIAAKAKATWYRTQDPGKYTPALSHTKGSENEWQIVGSRKRRAGAGGVQFVGAEGELIERRGPGRPKGSTNKLPNMTRAAAKASSINDMPTLITLETSRPVTRENTAEASEAPLCTMSQ